jgi:CBS domain-containing protein
MTRRVVTVKPDTGVPEIAALLLDHHISAVPVLDTDGGVVGIVSEGDLLHRHETETERPRSWWLSMVSLPEESAKEYIKSHGLHAGDVMTRDVVTVDEETPLGEVAQILEDRRIKRVPVLRDGRMVGIVSRANFLQGLVAHGHEALTPTSTDDRSIQEDVLAEIANQETGARFNLVTVIVKDGVVHLWGISESQAEMDAMRVVAENTVGVKAVESHLTPPLRLGLVVD